MTHKPALYDIALWAALPMAHTSRIEGRLTMILDTQRPRALPRRAGAAALMLAATLLLPLASAHPAPAQSAPTEVPALPAVRPAPVATRTLMSAKDQAEEKRLKQAEADDPTSPTWPAQLGFLYRLNVTDDGSPASRAWAQASLAQYDRAVTVGNQWMVTHRHVPPSAGPPVSEEIARMAFAAGDYDRARQCAAALLRIRQGPGVSDQQGNRHAANLVLGRLALRDGDTARAEQYLLAMGRTPGSPSLDTYGPNMRLAKDLLARGDRAPVLAYFDECAKFWTFNHGKTLNAWKAQVRAGKTPDFGGNLVY